jgi:hypothetical protein
MHPRVSALPALDTEPFGIHHPLAGPQRLSIARVSGYRSCVEVDICGANADPDAIGFVRVERLTRGTGPGSRGSGLFSASGQLVGVLMGGAEGGGFDYYGRIDRLPHPRAGIPQSRSKRLRRAPC